MRHVNGGELLACYCTRVSVKQEHSKMLLKTQDTPSFKQAVCNYSSLSQTSHSTITKHTKTHTQCTHLSIFSSVSPAVCSTHKQPSSGTKLYVEEKYTTAHQAKPTCFSGVRWRITWLCFRLITSHQQTN